MNRICKAFDDIGNINMNWAGVPPFNWQMLLSEPCMDNREDIVEEYCALDNVKTSILIGSAEESPNEKDNFSRYGILEEFIAYTLINDFGSLEKCYPYIVKHLFSAENESKSYHKQTFWRIFGDIAVEVLKKNLENYRICPECKAKIPNWVQEHTCITGGKGFFRCIDCGDLCERINAKQCRCPGCQEDHRKKSKNESKQRRRKERATQGCFTSWQSHFRKMS